MNRPFPSSIISLLFLILTWMWLFLKHEFLLNTRIDLKFSIILLLKRFRIFLFARISYTFCSISQEKGMLSLKWEQYYPLTSKNKIYLLLQKNKIYYLLTYDWLKAGLECLKSQDIIRMKTNRNSSVVVWKPIGSWVWALYWKVVKPLIDGETCYRKWFTRGGPWVFIA